MRAKKDPQIDQLSESLIDEMVTAVGLPPKRLYHNIFWSLFRGITNRLARIGVPFDRILAEQGLPAASEWILSHFCNPALVQGSDNIPKDGPLLVVSNHPGAYDGGVVFIHANRKDIKWIGTPIPFLDLLPNTRNHIFFASRKDSLSRAIAMRDAVRHLKAGGTLLYYAAGHRDPDPAVFPGAEKAMDGWLDVFDTFFKHDPGLRLLPCVISGIVSERWAHHPLTWLRRKQIDKHRLAEFGQVITQLMRPGKLMITPAISFGEPVNESTLRDEAQGDSLLPAVIARGKSLLRDHIQQFGGVL